MTLLCGTAHADKIAVANVTAEPDVGDEAGAVTLLVRSALAVGDQPIVDLPAQTTVGSALLAMEKASADYAVLMDLGRDGLKLRLTVVVVPRKSSAVVHVSRAGDGDVGGLARDAVGYLAKTLKLEKARVPDASLGQLRPFAAALRLRATDKAAAADALRDGNPHTAYAVSAITTLLAGVPAGGSDPSITVSAARAIGDIPTLDKIGGGTDDVALAARAIAALLRTDLATAKTELGATPPKAGLVTLAAAMLAELGDHKQLDALIVQGLASDRKRGMLSFASGVGGLEKATYSAMIAATDSKLSPGVASQVGLAALEANVDKSRALALISARDLDDLEVGRLEKIVGLGSDPTSVRLRAEIALRRGDDAKSQVAIGTFASEGGDDPRAARYQGWLLESKGKHQDAAAQFAKAGARREQMRALSAANDLKGARAAIEGDPKTAEELVTVAQIALAENKVPDAEKSLVAAEQAAPVSPVVQAVMVALGQKQNNKARIRWARLIAGMQPDVDVGPEPSVIVSGSDGAKPVGTKPDKVVIDLAPDDPRIIEPLLETLNLATFAKKKIVLAELGWSPGALSFRETHPEVVRSALAELLAAPPYEMQVTVEQKPFSGDTVQLDDLVKLVGEQDAALVYHLEANGSNARITLLLFPNGATQATQASRDVRMAGAVTFNTFKLVIIIGVIIVIGLLGVLYFTRSMGKVEVQIARATDTDEALCIEITKRASRPPIPDMLAFHEATKTAGTVNKRRYATLVASGHTFKVPIGHWHLHLYGTYSHAGKLRVVPDSCSRQIEVKRGATIEVAFDLVARLAEITVEVIAEPRKGIMVWVNNEATKRKTDDDGRVDLMLGVGHHTIHIQTATDTLSMPLHVPNPKSIRMTVNVARELRLGKDVELGVDTEKAGELELVLSQGPRTPLPFAAAVDPTSKTVHASKPALPAQTSPMERYRITAEIGRGAMGVVHRGWDEKLEREVAIKVMADELRSIPEAMELFVSEAKALAQLNHTNIVAMYDQVTDADKVYMIMEYVDGTTLEQIISQRKVLPWFEAAGIIDQACAGLQYAHARKVIHRDIKPANIFVANDKTVKLGDFGLARVMREVVIRKTQVRGTPLYMAPEQITGIGVDHRADLYAIGCTLFELVTGRPPFIDGDILYAQTHTAPPSATQFTPDLPPALDKLLNTLLAKKPDDRPASAAEVRMALRDLPPA